MVLQYPVKLTDLCKSFIAPEGVQIYGERVDLLGGGCS